MRRCYKVFPGELRQGDGRDVAHPGRRAAADLFAFSFPFSPRSGKVLLAKVVSARRARRGTITYVEEDGTHETVPVTGEAIASCNGSLDMGMRWAALGVDYEMCGKDHLTHAKWYDYLWIGGRLAARPIYVLSCFWTTKARRRPSPRAMAISIEQWLTMGLRKALALFMFQKPCAPPSGCTSMSFPARWMITLRFSTPIIAGAATDEQRLDNPVWHTHGRARCWTSVIR